MSAIKLRAVGTASQTVVAPAFVTSATDGAARIEAVAGGCPALADANREDDDGASSIA